VAAANESGPPGASAATFPEVRDHDRNELRFLALRPLRGRILLFVWRDPKRYVRPAFRAHVGDSDADRLIAQPLDLRYVGDSPTYRRTPAVTKRYTGWPDPILPCSSMHFRFAQKSSLWSVSCDVRRPLLLENADSAKSNCNHQTSVEKEPFPTLSLSIP
jgi:hypothetical protein